MRVGVTQIRFIGEGSFFRASSGIFLKAAWALYSSEKGSTIAGDLQASEIAKTIINRKFASGYSLAVLAIVTLPSFFPSTDNTDGNLQVMAQVIAEETGADVFHILVEEPYDPDYSTMLPVDGKSGLKDFEGILQRFGIGCRSESDLHHGREQIFR